MRTKKGIITSAKMTGTVTVTVDSHAFHPKYKKRYKISKKFLADTAGHALHEGDFVLISECRPLSKNKYFKVMEVLKKSAEVGELSTEKEVEAAMHREKVAPKVPEKKKESKDDTKEDGSKKTETKSSDDVSPQQS